MTSPILSPEIYRTTTPTIVDDSAGNVPGLKSVPKTDYSEKLVETVAKNSGSVKAQSVPLTDNEIRNVIKSNAPAGTFALLSEQDQRWMSIAIELFRILSDDSLSQQAMRDKMSEVVNKLAEKLKDHKYKEADIQVTAAIAGAVASVVVAVAGAVCSAKGLGANPGGPSLQSISGQALSSLTQTVGNLVSQIIGADATREQGEAELTRASKENALNSMSSYNKSADVQQELVKKIMELLSRFFEARTATLSQLVNNART
ncbi:hypothetical protein L9H26_11755 [Morganella psychrotolerans]|uniref:Uncharacterized protein n=1 Tax=Morganella psychrotolerans TaxID=368603 RepID=A0A5M9R7M7_9GAMM|nr:hypothetical protein [Morganella psychrotolerans]KAA8715435.1 hypothetical protein F4V73_10690 [Morganella psychrotolerans]OBU05484.1 hypothetical protein AYY16_09505 [Morganella psychrotolerans]